MVTIAAERGRISSSSRPSVINATAGARRFPSRACRDFSSGQVETTTIVAQIPAVRNGRKTHSVVAMSSSRHMTASVVRVRSWRTALAEEFSGAVVRAGSESVVMAGRLSCFPVRDQPDHLWATEGAALLRPGTAGCRHAGLP